MNGRRDGSCLIDVLVFTPSSKRSRLLAAINCYMLLLALLEPVYTAKKRKRGLLAMF